MAGYSKSEMIGLGIAFLILPIIAVALRIYAKFRAIHRLTVDDYLVFVALAVAIGCCIVQLIAAIDGSLGQHEVDYPNGAPVLTNPQFGVYERCKFAIDAMSFIGLGCNKAAFLFFYKQIFGINRVFRIFCWVMLGLVFVWTVSFFFALIFTCDPVSPYIEAFYHNNCYHGLQSWYAAAGSDVIIDLIILIMPIPMVVRLQAHWKKKLFISGMFFLGVITLAISVTRLVEFVKVAQGLAKNYGDETYITSPVFFWTVIESSVTVIAACLPTYGPLFMPLVRGFNSPKKASTKYTSYESPSGLHARSNPIDDKDEYHEEIMLTSVARVMSAVSANLRDSPREPDPAHITVRRDFETISEQVNDHERMKNGNLGIESNFGSTSSGINS